VPLTHASLLHMMTREVIVMMTPKSKRRTLHCGTAPAVAWDQNPKQHKFRGATHWLVAAWQSPAGAVLEPERPETAGDIPQDLTSRSTASRSNDESWDFDENEQDFGEERNPPKPHANP
jgi:hypothetical protein